jgi:hypothetical protein
MYPPSRWKTNATDRQVIVPALRPERRPNPDRMGSYLLRWAPWPSGKPASLGHNPAARRKSRLSGTGLTAPSLRMEQFHQQRRISEIHTSEKSTYRNQTAVVAIVRITPVGEDALTGVVLVGGL